ncbi:hypothetical protein GLOIN_2v831856 [Rhizophagus clarus]|uniref:Uncharacterized protein n=1 Tax=Rhizophagus clarus TaxID=94130 RepID=A0A8H3QM34_9GLOM|nr:hypothetical protein GLOIN_2v831856 [Rhizophagus clarus]
MDNMTLKEEIMLPSSKVDNFYKPAYWEILDFTNESLYVTGFMEEEIKELAQDFVNSIKGEIQADLLKREKVDMRSILIVTSSKFEAVYGNVVGGLQPSGMSTTNQERRFHNKLTLMIDMRDSLNSLLMEYKMFLMSNVWISSSMIGFKLVCPICSRYFCS